MMRAGVIAAALAMTATRVGFAKEPKIVAHADLADRLDGDALKASVRGAVGAGHTSSSPRRPSQPCTFVRKPGKRALRRMRGKAA